MADVLRITFNAAKAAARLNIVVNSELRKFKAAVRNTMIQGGAEIWTRVDKDIRRAGKFSDRWPAAFTVANTFQGFDAHMRVGFNNSIPYAHVHEFGATIRGKPLLWIPLSFGNAPNIGPGSTRARARDYPYGKLFRVERPGKNPLLFSKDGPQYVGVRQVTLRSRFHIRAIVANVVRTKLAKLFARYVQGVKS